MGAACSDVKKKKSHKKKLKAGQLDESEDSDDVPDAIIEDPDSEDEAEDEEQKRQAVENAVKNTMATLKRGKTQALKEAIAGAKKLKGDATLIKAAEKRLADHKHDQRRDEVKEELMQFMESDGFEEIEACAKMETAAMKADVIDEDLKQLRDKLYLLRVCRELEDDEDDQAFETVQESSQEFFDQAISDFGRPVIFFDSSTGGKCVASLSVDPPVRHLILTLEITDEDKIIIKKTLLAKVFCVIQNFELEGIPISKLTDSTDSDGKAQDLVVAVKHSGELISPRAKSPRGDNVRAGSALEAEKEHGEGFWIFVEATVPRRDKLFEAIMFLQHLAAECSA